MGLSQLGTTNLSQKCSQQSGELQSFAQIANVGF